MWGFVEKCSCVKIWHCVLTLPIAMLSMRSLDSATVLYSNSYYTVVASIFLVSAASCKAICEVTSVRTSDYSQPLWLKRHALLMPHVIIKYVHVLICISAGEGSRHFSAFHLVGNQELTPKASVLDYPPNKVSLFWETIFEVTFCGLSKEGLLGIKELYKSCVAAWVHL